MANAVTILNSLFSSVNSELNSSKTNDLDISKANLGDERSSTFQSITEKQPLSADDSIVDTDINSLEEKLEKLTNKIKDYIEDKKEPQLEEIDPNAYIGLINMINTQLENRIDTTTKEIAFTDLKSPDGVSLILEKSANLENYQDLQKLVQDFSQNLTENTQTDSITKSVVNNAIKPNLSDALNNPGEFALPVKLEEELSPEVQNKINELVQALQKKNAEETTSPEPVDLPTINLLKEYSAKEVKTDTKKSNPKDLEFTDLIQEIKEERPEELNLTGFDGSADSDTKQEESSSETGNERSENPDLKIQTETKPEINLDPSIFASTKTDFEVKPHAIKAETIHIHELKDFIETQIENTKVDIPKEIRLELTPGDLGKVELTITRNDKNEISIKMVFASEKSMHSMKENLKDSLVELREVLKGKDLNLTKFEVAESQSSNNFQTHHHSHNEAKEEQKRRFMDAQPAWIKESSLNFKSTLEEILN